MTGVLQALFGFTMGALFVVLIVCAVVIWDAHRVHRLSEQKRPRRGDTDLGKSDQNDDPDQAD